MKSLPAINNLEVALIDLEYAAADFSHRKSSTTDPLAISDFTTLLSKLVAANRAVQMSIGALSQTPQTDLANCAA